MHGTMIFQCIYVAYPVRALEHPLNVIIQFLKKTVGQTSKIEELELSNLRQKRNKQRVEEQALVPLFP